MSGPLPLPTPMQMPAVVPERIGAYPIRAVIGTGSMGVVYLGHDPVIDRPVAVKTIQRYLLEDNAGSSGAAQRFRVEARAAGRLNHRGIVAVHQFGEDENCAYIVMEYVRGHSLADYLRPPEWLGPGEALSVMAQLLDALHYAHESGVVHRDIKPANLMIDGYGRVKITDFGIARTDAPQVTRVNTLVGSPGYMAPEQYTGGPLDRRVDIFSAGVLLYQMLAREMPFAGTDENIMYQIVYGDHQPLVQRTGDATLAPFEAVIDKALSKSPDQRYPTALAFLEALKAAAGGAIADHLAHSRLLPYKAPQAGGVATNPPASGSRPSSTPGATPSQPRPTTTPSEAIPTGWDESALATLEKELTRHVGPVAKVLVRRAARGQVDLAVVRQIVAANIVDAEVRQRFLSASGTTLPGALRRAAAASSGFAETQASTGGTDAGRLGPQEIERATAAATRLLGPIAGVLVKRCAQQAPTRDRFVAMMIEQTVDRIDAAMLEKELWRSLR